jgi:hypothetical protein
MRNLTTFFATLFCLLYLNPLTSFAQPCTGPKKVTHLNDYPKGFNLVWGAGTGQEGIAYRENGTSNWTTIANVKSPYFVSGLKTATYYEVAITSSCYGNVPSPPYARFLTDEECAVASNISVTSLKINSATFSWSQNSGGTGYLAYREAGTGGYKIISPLPPSPYTLRGLKTNTVYEYYLGTNCRVSPGVFSQLQGQPQQFTTAKEASCADGGLYLETRSENSVVAKWGNSGNITSIQLCYKEINTGKEPTCVTLPTTAASYEITSDAKKSYEVTLTTTCSDGTVFTNVESSNTACPTPINFTITPDYGNVFNLNWDYSANSITDFRVDLYGIGTPPYFCTPDCDRILNQAPSYKSQSWGFVPGTTLFTVRTTCPNGTVSELNTSYSYSGRGGEGTLVSANTTNNINAVSLKNTRDYTVQNAANTISRDEAIELGIEIPAMGILPAVHAKKSSLRISPNPANSFVTIDLPNAGFGQINITTIEGRVLKQVQVDENTVSQKIDCSEIPNGLYFLSAKGLGKVVTAKFVKN